MRLCHAFSLSLLAAVACNDDEPSTPSGTPDAPVTAPTFDAPTADGAPTSLPDGGAITEGSDAGVVQLQQGTLPGVTVLGAGQPFLDVTTDLGENVWGVTAEGVYLYRGGVGDGLRYDQANGLAQGQTTWIDSYWFGTPENPSTQAVTFSAVAGGGPGQVFVGNIGKIGDRLDVDPATGAVLAVQGLALTELQQPDPTELGPQQQREVATWHAVVDMSGPNGGAAYFGGWHGTSVLHGMAQARASGLCACGDYEQHVHPFAADDTLGGDVHALAVTPQGDLWMGDRKAIYFMPLGSLGTAVDFFQNLGLPGKLDNLSVIDAWPGVDDWTYGIALDASGGIYVASLHNGFAYLSPGSYLPTYFELPTAVLTGVAVDAQGEVWIASNSQGVFRYSPSAGVFTQYTTSGGLPSNRIKQVFVDPHAATRTVYFATDSGIAVYAGP